MAARDGGGPCCCWSWSLDCDVLHGRIGEFWEREQEDLEGERWKYSEIGDIERQHGDGNNRRERENE